MATKAKTLTLADAKQQLEAALRNGDETAQIRADISRLEAEAKTQQATASKQAAEKRRQKEAAVEDAATRTADNARQAIDAGAVVDGLEAVLPDGEALASAEHSPELDHGARAVAVAQAALDEATTTHRQRAAEVSKLQERIAVKRQREDELRQARLNGDEDHAAELHAIGLDIEGLEELLQSARVAANNALPTKEQKALTEAQRHLDSIRAKATVRLLEDRTRQAEEVFVQAHRQLVDAAMAAGAGNRHTVFRASDAVRFIVYGTTN